MSEIQEAIIDELKNDSTIYSKLWNSTTNTFYAFPLITPEKRLSDNQDYFFTYTKIDNPEDIVLDIQKPLFKFNCFGRKYSQSVALRNDVCRIFNRKKDTLGSTNTRTIIMSYKTEEYELYDDSADLYYVTLNFVIQFKGDNV